VRNERQHFIIPYRLDGRDRCLLWFSDKRDGVLLTETGTVATFANQESATAFAQERSLSVELDTSGHWDFDVIAQWISAPAAGRIDCDHIYNVWNLLGDIAESIGAALEFSDEELHVHEKLFWGCNIAAVTPSNERFVPEWPADQIDTLANALLDGLRLARDSIDTRID
jgi:hypothetical protein